MKPKTSPALWVLLAALLLVPLTAAVVAFIRGNQPAGEAKNFNGSVISPPQSAPDFTLSSAQGKVSLSGFRGKIVLLSFGFTNCPDYCPNTMSELRQARKELGDLAAKVQVILVTTDPQRDTPKQMANYLGAFDPTFIGLTASPAKLENVYKDYGVTVMEGGESHSTRIYLVDQQGNLRLTFPYGMNAAEIAQDIRKIEKP